jgi:hypothetical protein
LIRTTQTGPSDRDGSRIPHFHALANKERTIYVSIRFATATHLCCCGCGNKVVTPLRPTDWSLIFDGKTISLDPSIGNWSFLCQSHYWIQNDRVRWAAQWTKKEIEAGRAQDRTAKEKYFGNRNREIPAGLPITAPTSDALARRNRGWWDRVRKWWSE